jgi:RNA-binding protein YlmH
MSSNNNGYEFLARRVEELSFKAAKSGRTFMTAFLSPAEQKAVSRITAGDFYYFDGGRKDALRKVLVIGEDCKIEQGCVCLYSPLDPRFDALQHKDVLGALMHLGIERECIGDIATSEDAVYIACVPNMADYIADSLLRIKRQSVQFHQCSFDDMPVQQYEIKVIHPASMRADVLVAAIAGCSRSKALELIKVQSVKVNDAVLENTSPLCNNDIISVRGKGKYRIGECRNVSRKGRLALEIEKFL